MEDFETNDKSHKLHIFGQIMENVRYKQAEIRKSVQ